ncbi:MAG: hypothetical protein IT383_12235 [Deltaproteobacteria bacterium]|nr:hypothetical protein [Deltaproteobacteria bacterium]
MAGAPDPTSVALELDEARAALKRASGQMHDRMRQLDELWAKAKPADRLLAVQRLVQSGALEKAVNDEIDVKNELVRELLGHVRHDRKKSENNPGDHDLRHRLFLLELQCQRAEQERDEAIDKSDLRGPLYFCGETFVRSDPFGPGETALKDLATRIQFLQERVTELEKMDRRGARFTAVQPDGRELTLIRMLPALTMSGEGAPDKGEPPKPVNLDDFEADDPTLSDKR